MISATDIFSARILIVDDQQVNVDLLEQMLRGAGYQAVTATRDPHAVGALHLRHRYDLILLDLQMPGMDGFEVMDALKTVETSGYLPVLVITAEPSHKLRALRAGARDFVSKPFDLAEVLMRVHNMLEVRLLHRAATTYGLALERTVNELIAEQRLSAELSAQPGAMVGVGAEEHLSTPLMRSLWLRHPWLQLNLVTAFAAGGVVLLFQGTIDRLLILTIFLPVLAGQSGNTGCQSLAVTLRGVFLGELNSGRETALVMKEALLGLMNGVLVGALAASVMYGVARAQHLANAGALGAVVLLAMTGSCVVSGVCGAVVPLTLKKLGADPATASSIFLTTATDMVSMGMLLGLASLLVK